MSQSSLNEKQWLMLCHASTLLMFVIPFGNIIGPVIIYLMKKDESPAIADQAKESINFQITVTIAFIASLILMIVLIGVFLLFAVVVANVVLIIIAIIKTDEGQLYRYPFKIRFIS